jgi:Flp pilus assembly protein TadD
MSIEHALSGGEHHQAIRDEMVSFGERLIRAGRLDEAEQVFCRLVQFYPESAAAYASLGDFYMRSGDEERA